MEMVVETVPLMIKWSIDATLNVTLMINMAMKNCYRIIAYHVSMFQLAFCPPNVRKRVVRWPACGDGAKKKKNRNGFSIRNSSSKTGKFWYISVFVFEKGIMEMAHKTGKLTCDETVRSDGNRSSNFPKRVGWFGYCVRQYSSKAHWDFSCNDSICAMSDSPQASVHRSTQMQKRKEKIN